MLPACLRHITPSTAGQFFTAFRSTDLDITEGLDSFLHPVEFITSFQYTSTKILDSIFPLKRTSTKAKTEPWLNDRTQAVRQRCRKVEHRWKKDRLHVSQDILIDSF